VFLKPKPKLRKLAFEYDFSQLEIKGKGSQGNILSKHSVKNVVKREEGVSTLGARDIWYDDTVKRLNTDGRGVRLGAFMSDEKILTIQQSGFYKLMNYDLSNHFEEDMIQIEKFDPGKIFSAIYFEASTTTFYLKRFQIEEETPINKKVDFIGESPENYLVGISQDWLPQVKVVFDTKANKKELPDIIVNAAEFIGVKSAKAKGKRITIKVPGKIEFIEPLPYEPLVIEDQQMVHIETEPKAIELIEKPEAKPEIIEILSPEEEDIVKQAKKPAKKKKENHKDKKEDEPEEAQALSVILPIVEEEIFVPEKKPSRKKKENRKDKPEDEVKQMELF
jgi:topoisomerase-4 subunit A